MSDDSRVSETEFRKVELLLRGAVYENFGYEFKADISTGELNIADAAVSYNAGPAVINLGYLDPIDELTIPSHREFMEGAAIEGAFPPGNQIGIVLYRENEHSTFAAGAFRRSLDGTSVVDEGRTFSGRFTVAPRMHEDYLLHIGGYASWRKGDAGQYRYSARSLLRTGARYVDTGRIAHEDLLVGLELAGYVRSLALEGQCAMVRASVTTDSASKANLHGCYLAGLWHITGESRRYRNGSFSRVNVSDPVFQGGIGAWNVAVRYDMIDLSNADVTGGAQSSWTAALNWYLSNQFWVAANYGHTRLNSEHTAKDTTHGMALRAHYEIRW